MSAPFIDTLDSAYDADIHAAHAAAREKSWYAETPAGILVLRYADVLAVLRDRRWRELGADGLAAAGIRAGPLWDWFQQIMSTQEGEAHARLRRLVSQAFTPRSVERLRPLMREVTHELVDRFAARGRCEFVAEFAAPYPVRVIGALLGVPPGDFERFHAWSSDLSLAFSSRIAEERPRIERGLARLSEYVDGLIGERRRRPEADLIRVSPPRTRERLDADETARHGHGCCSRGQTQACQLACAATPSRASLAGGSSRRIPRSPRARGGGAALRAAGSGCSASPPANSE